MKVSANNLQRSNFSAWDTTVLQGRLLHTFKHSWLGKSCWREKLTFPLIFVRGTDLSLKHQLVIFIFCIHWPPALRSFLQKHFLNRSINREKFNIEISAKIWQMKSVFKSWWVAPAWRGSWWAQSRQSWACPGCTVTHSDHHNWSPFIYLIHVALYNRI